MLQVSQFFGFASQWSVSVEFLKWSMIFRSHLFLLEAKNMAWKLKLHTHEVSSVPVREIFRLMAVYLHSMCPPLSKNQELITQENAEIN